MVEGGGLENRCPVMSGTGGSNPSPSAMGSEQLSAMSRQFLLNKTYHDISHKLGVKGIKHS